jgi:AraC family transcriptional regulator
MHPEIRNLTKKYLAGKRLKMSFTLNRTSELWRSFMPHRKEILNAAGPELYSVEVYGPSHFAKFNPAAEFDKWAAVEVKDTDTVPEGMETLTLPAGLYAVFNYRGPASQALATYQNIFQNWLPQSHLLVDDRPHFTVMGERYKGEEQDSEEEIWIPVKPE